MSNSIEKLAKEAERLAKNLQENPFSAFDRIVKDIQEQKENAMAMEFTKCIGELLKKNGVVPKITEYTHEKVRENSIEHRYGVSIDKLDFSEHDKVFEDKIVELENIINHKLGGLDEYGISYKEILDMKAENQELKQRIAELENKETAELPFDALETANMLINATYRRKVKSFDRLHCCDGYKITTDMYCIDDLEQIAEHLLVYCKHNKESEE